MLYYGIEREPALQAGQPSRIPSVPENRPSQVSWRREAFVMQYAPTLWRVARRYERDHHRRQELHQDMLVSLWRSLAEAQPDGSVKSWAAAVAHRVGAAHRLKIRRRKVVHNLVAGDEIDAIGDIADQEADLEAREWMGRVEGIMRDLDSADRALMELRLQGCDSKEIGEITGRTEATIRHRLDRVMRRVQIKLQKSGYRVARESV